MTTSFRPAWSLYHGYKEDPCFKKGKRKGKEEKTYLKSRVKVSFLLTASLGYMGCTR